MERKTYPPIFPTRLDAIRDLLVIDHPFAPSRSDGFAEWSVQTVPPSDWRPDRPLFLSFYKSDNYSGTTQQDAWTGTQAFIGHRFKQAMVDGHLVWESDVAYEEMDDPRQQPEDGPRSGYREPYRVVDITPYAAPRMTITFRVEDCVASAAKLPGDVYKRFAWSAHNPEKVAKNFQTTAYFGDVCLTTENRIVHPERPPVRSRARRVSLRTSRPTGIPFTLTAGRLPAFGYPVRSGVAFAQGVVPAGVPVALCDPKGRLVSFSSSALSHWPDGSIRWLLCEFVATQNGRYRVLVGLEPAAPEHPVKIETNGEKTTVTNGVFTLDVGAATGSGVFDGLSLVSGLSLGNMDLSVKLNRVGWRDHFTAHRRGILIEQASPVCAVIPVEGDLVDEKGQRFGPWRARVQVWTGGPYLLADWRMVNESDQAMAMLLDWSAHTRLPDLEDAVVDFGPFTPGYDPDDIGVKASGHRCVIRSALEIPLYRNSELSCRQERADQARLYRNTAWVATTGQAAGYVRLQHPRGTV
ncbi:MAG: hypothetical protein FJY97_11520, partial [candidate division Zixibacteria bacterium]|nr:hypothetical protein [candidate division Zixibacteria bacterium]